MRWLHELIARLQRELKRRGGSSAERQPPPSLTQLGPAHPIEYRPLRCVVLTNGVLQLLFDEYESHRRGERGDEETGWVLLGWREEEVATIRATLPAGTEREAGEAHVKFNSEAQALASRIVRQADRRLALLGVVHTHPGSLRHPSDGDYRGDIEWVGQLRGGVGVFGIGTADGKYAQPVETPWQPRPNMNVLRELGFTWYTLGECDRNYRACPIETIDGPDLAKPLRLVWDVLEDNSVRLERLARQQAKVSFEVGAHGLTLSMPLADGSVIRATMSKDGVRYFVIRGGESLTAELHEPRVDCGVYQLLAELAGNDDISS